MAYPNLERYNQAFSAHSALLSDPELKAGILATSGLGLPLAISGGFALTYTVTTARGKFAVRCFHRESKGLEQRYAAIATKLSSVRSPYFLDFRFQPQGIRVDGTAYPTVKMEWAVGTTLGEFLEDNRSNAAALGRLADALIALAAYLQKEGIAHGDLQSGNLMVSRDGALVQLIDYDGMFVEGIRSLGSAELGHVNFQHPQRKTLNPFDATLDRFSLIALFVAIRALQADTSLWDKTNSEADAVIFRANDFLHPASSSAFALVAKTATLGLYAKNFAAVCKSPMAHTPSLADFIAGHGIPASSVVIAPPNQAGVFPAAGRPSYVGAYSVLAATDYTGCLRAVGNKVEVIGRIVEIKQDKTRRGKPYVFVNFGPWKGKIFKAAIWSDGLAHVKKTPGPTWVGKWVSVVGLMEPPYVNNRYLYSHLAITVGVAGTISIITQKEAEWRLAGAGKTAGAFTAVLSPNQRTLDEIKTTLGVPAPLTSSRAPSTATSPNKDVLTRIRVASGFSSSPSVNSGPSPSPSTGGNQRFQRYQAPPGRPSLIKKFFEWLFG